MRVDKFGCDLYNRGRAKHVFSTTEFVHNYLLPHKFEEYVPIFFLLSI